MPPVQRGALALLLQVTALSGAMCFQTWIPTRTCVDHVRIRRLAGGVPSAAGSARRGGVLACRLTADGDLQSLADKLKQGMNSWKDFDEPEPETKRAKVKHFMDITGSKDVGAAEAKLESFGWDVEQAVKDGRTYTQKMAAVLNKKGVTKVKVAIAKAAVARNAPPPLKAPASRSEYVCRIEVSKHGRGGKTVTVINGLELLPVDEKKALLTKLKNAVAAGGKMSDNGGLEVQGEHAEAVLKIMVAEQFTNCKISGGVPKKKGK
jgi:translation initiation factor 1